MYDNYFFFDNVSFNHLDMCSLYSIKTAIICYLFTLKYIYLKEKKNLTGMASIILLNLANPKNSFELIFSLSESRPQAAFPDQMYC